MGNEVCPKLAADYGVFDAEISLCPDKREMQVLPSPGARAIGVTVAELVAQLRHSLHARKRSECGVGKTRPRQWSVTRIQIGKVMAFSRTCASAA